MPRQLYKVYYHVDSRGDGYIEWNIDVLEVLVDNEDHFIVREEFHGAARPLIGEENYHEYRLPKPLTAPYFATEVHAQLYLVELLGKGIALWKQKLRHITSWLQYADQIIRGIKDQQSR
jgi:hypothetical protein